jgi:hypothetical protein
MTLVRTSSWTLLAATGFALAIAPVGARQAAKEELPRRPGLLNELTELKAAAPIPAAQLPRAKEVFAAYGKYLTELISSPIIYRATAEFVPDTRNPVKTLDQINADLTRDLLIPEPAGGKVGRDQADYIRELGIALDASLKKLIEEGPPNKEYEQIVKLNAARLLATAARTGAAAHYPTVTALLKNPGTPPEVKVYALKAAEHLLGAYHIDVHTTQKRDHSVHPKVLIELVQALEDVIVAPNKLEAGQPAAAAPEPPTPEQLAVNAYIRRQAVKALAQCRFASITVPPGGPTTYPAHTLARVIYSDPALNPPPNPAEIAEATLGLCNMSPTRGYNEYAAADAVATGIIAFATPRAVDKSDHRYPWRAYAARLTEGLRLWKGVFDRAYDPTRPSAPTAPPPAVVAEITSDEKTGAIARVLIPIERSATDTTVTIDIAGMTDLRDRIRKNPKRGATLFQEVPSTSVDIPARKP